MEGGWGRGVGGEWVVGAGGVGGGRLGWWGQGGQWEAGVVEVSGWWGAGEARLGPSTTNKRIISPFNTENYG